MTDNMYEDVETLVGNSEELIQLYETIGHSHYYKKRLKGLPKKFKSLSKEKIDFMLEAKSLFNEATNVAWLDAYREECNPNKILVTYFKKYHEGEGKLADEDEEINSKLSSFFFTFRIVLNEDLSNYYLRWSEGFKDSGGTSFFYEYARDKVSTYSNIRKKYASSISFINTLFIECLEELRSWCRDRWNPTSDEVRKNLLKLAGDVANSFALINVLDIYGSINAKDDISRFKSAIEVLIDEIESTMEPPDDVLTEKKEQLDFVLGSYIKLQKWSSNEKHDLRDYNLQQESFFTGVKAYVDSKWMQMPWLTHRLLIYSLFSYTLKWNHLTANLFTAVLLHGLKIFKINKFELLAKEVQKENYDKEEIARQLRQLEEKGLEFNSLIYSLLKI